MTQPPQPPHDGGQHPGQFPPPGGYPPPQPGWQQQPFPQQPGQFGGPQGQYPPAPGYPGDPAGPYPQVDPTTGQPLGQQPPYQGGYPGVGGYATQSNPYGLPGDAFGPRPGRGKTPWVIGIAALAVIGLTVTLVLVLTSGGGTGSPGATAESAADAIGAQDVAAFNKLVCDPSDALDDGDLGRGAARGGESTTKVKRAEVTRADDEGTNGRASAEVAVELTNGRSFTAQLDLREREAGGDWCVRNLTVGGIGVN
ncbi:hypothetical protein [Actinokineospora bangkokensis]|uniref:DUF4878 domain-containing protein n=1 Tax=Actinokineospora bangkokensis TaxID=1193682 RepID=A0A1Q9LN08_9PSEU|nr:hypothetical protein [Actinokineospora bangkokensis]OLR93422.1 hypothetical protein BJP25_14005 [Actinokineospora bangkokensis]